jgi:hypothetical protein
MEHKSISSGPAASVKEEVMSDEGRDIQQSSLEPNSAVTGDSPSGKRESEVSGPAASADDVIEFTTRLTTDPVTGEKRMLTTAGPAASVKHICAQDDRKLPIDRPCSACSGGDPEMKYHDHCPPFRQTAASAEPRCQELIVCNETREHAIHDPAEGHHPFKESAESRTQGMSAEPQQQFETWVGPEYCKRFRLRDLGETEEDEVINPHRTPDYENPRVQKWWEVWQAATQNCEQETARLKAELDRLKPKESAEPRTPEADEVQKRKEAGIQSYDGGQLGASLLQSAEPRMVSVNEPRFNCPNCSASVAESAREQHSWEGCVTSASRTEERLRIGTPDTALGVDKDDYKPHKARPQSAEPGEQFEKFAVTRKLPLDKLPADRQQETGYCYRDKSTNACSEAWRAGEAYAASEMARLRAERKVYAWQKRPDRCPECDSECFITSGGMNLTCYHCFLSEQTEKAEAERDGLREALRELQACCKKVKWFLGSQSHSWYPKDDAMLEDAIVKAEAELSAAAPTKKTDSPK